MPHNFLRETPAEFEARVRIEHAAGTLLDMVVGYPESMPEFDDRGDLHVALEEADHFAVITDAEREELSADGYVDLARQYVADRPILVDLLLRAKVEVAEEGVS